MRFNNYKAIKYVPFVYFFTVISIIAFVILELQFSRENSSGKIFFWFFIGILFLLMIYIYAVGKFFEFDSDGETLCFTSRGAFLSDNWNYREKRAEFPKKKLKSFYLSNYFFHKSLVLTVRSSKDYRKVKKVRFNITLLSYNRIKLLDQSLNKVIQQNKA